MLDAVVANEKEPDVVQISGGEPTIHPQFFDILDYAKTLPIRGRHLARTINCAQSNLVMAIHEFSTGCH